MNDTFMAIGRPATAGIQREQKPPRGVSARALVPAVVMGALFVAIMISVATAAGWVAQFDGAVEGFVISLRSDAISPIFRTLSLIGSTKVLVPIAVVFIVFLIIKKQFKALLFFVVACGVAVAVCFAVKFGVGRPRPLDFLLDAELVEKEPCFPSGHSWNTISVFGTMFAIINTYTANVKRFRGVAKLFLFIAIVLPLAIGFSRLYMGEHYPTDVLAGWLGGAFFTLLFGSWYMRRFTEREKPVSPAWQAYSAARDINPWESFEARPQQQAQAPAKKSKKKSGTYEGRHSK